MNPSQQHQHKTRTDALALVLKETQGAVVERFEEVEQSFAAMHEKVERLIEGEHTRIDACAYTIDEVDLRLNQFIVRGLWRRLNWLVTGR